MPDLFHLAVRAEWDAAGVDYAPAAFADEGFVHCSYARQVVATAARHYAGRDDLVLLEIDAARLDAPVVEEPSPASGENYPHIYSRIPRSAVVTEHEFVPDAEGAFALPGTIRQHP
jgi:uncharacterized protein (DUF952 family)